MANSNENVVLEVPALTGGPSTLKGVCTGGAMPYPVPCVDDMCTLCEWTLKNIHDTMWKCHLCPCPRVILRCVRQTIRGFLTTACNTQWNLFQGQSISFFISAPWTVRSEQVYFLCHFSGAWWFSAFHHGRLTICVGQSVSAGSQKGQHFKLVCPLTISQKVICCW